MCNSWKWYSPSQVAGWSTNNGQAIELWGNKFLGVSPVSGSTIAELDADKHLDALMQTIKTVKDTKYDVSFYLRSRTSRFNQATETAVVEFNGEKLGDCQAVAKGQWKKCTFSVVGTGGYDVFKVREVDVSGSNDTLGVLLDAFVFRPAPQQPITYPLQFKTRSGSKKNAVSIQNPKSQKCLGFKSTAKDSQLLHLDCKDSDSFLFLFSKCSDGLGYTVKNLQSGLCLASSGSRTGDKIVQRPCNVDDVKQQFILEGSGDKHRLVLKSHRMCFNLYGAKVENDKMVQWPCSGDWNEFFTIDGVDPDNYLVNGGFDDIVLKQNWKFFKSIPGWYVSGWDARG